jgi:hypothetical protein
MKTTSSFSIIILLLFFAGINTVQSGNDKTSKPVMTQQMNIRYQVEVYLFSRIELCNTYLVEVTDETGRLVAPAKVFVPGISQYMFTEPGPAQGRVRVAKLVLATGTDVNNCNIHLAAREDVKMGPFVIGQTYPFVLRPILTAPLDKD